MREINKPSIRRQGPLRGVPGLLRHGARAGGARAVGARDAPEELRADGDRALRGDRRRAAPGL